MLSSKTCPLSSLRAVPRCVVGERLRNFSLFSAAAAKVLQKIHKPLVSLFFFIWFFRNGFRGIMPIALVGLGATGRSQ
jgi:hypothetical protein